MSAELALAVIPLCFEAVRLSKALLSRAKTFGSHMDVVEYMRTRFQTQVMLFDRECRRFVKEAAATCPGVEISEVFNNIQADGVEDSLSSQNLEESLNAMFGESIDTFKELLNTISKRIEDMDEVLSRYGTRARDGTEVGVSSGVDRSMNRLRITFSEEKHKKELEELATLVSDLRKVRQLVTSDGASSSRARFDPIRRIPDDYFRRKEDAVLWLETMTRNWSCREEQHLNSAHEVKLLLVTNDVAKTTSHCLDIIVHTETPLRCSSAQVCVRPRSKHRVTGSSGAAYSQMTGSPRDPKMRGKGTETKKWQSASPKLAAKGLLENGPINLAGSSNICRFLHRISSSDKLCLDFEDKSLDIFPGHKVRGSSRGEKPHGKIQGLQDVFTRDLNEVTGDSTRFWLANVIIKSALRHHGTAWWPEDWTPDLLSFYNVDCYGLGSVLDTLHVTSKLPPASRDSQSQLETARPVKEESCISSTKGKSIATEAAEARDLRDAMTEVGIRNLTLWGLGVALLQIGLWRYIPWGDHVQVRGSVSELKRFSKQYHDITDRLINCDFGVGADLKSLSLQNAVYSTVVCELDGTLKALTQAGLWHM
ncbi:Fc.00g085370.m01.CDS01 [Cosmosporella sp. VM-42]